MRAPDEEVMINERTFAVRIVFRRTNARGTRGAFDRRSMNRKPAKVRAERLSGIAVCKVKNPSVAAIVNA